MKPHKGCIAIIKMDPGGTHVGRALWVIFYDHPQFAGKIGHTSEVIKCNCHLLRGEFDGYEVETRNTRYTVVPRR